LKNRPFRERLGFALNGWRLAFRGEASFRFQLLAAVGVLNVLLILRPPLIWAAVLLVLVGAVLAAELFNTALERVVDKLHPEIHPEIGAVKDCAAGAVLVLSVTSVLVFTLFLVSYFRH